MFRTRLLQDMVNSIFTNNSQFKTYIFFCPNGVDGPCKYKLLVYWVVWPSPSFHASVCVSHFHSVSLLCFEIMTYFFTNCSCWWVTLCSKLTHYLQSYCPLTISVVSRPFSVMLQDKELVFQYFCWDWLTLGHVNNGWQQKNFGTFVGRLLKVNQTVTTVFVYYLVKKISHHAFWLNFFYKKIQLSFLHHAWHFQQMFIH